MNYVDLIIKIIALIPPFFTLFLTLKKRTANINERTKPPAANQSINAQFGDHSTNNIQQNQVMNSYNQTTNNNYHTQPSTTSLNLDPLAISLIFWIGWALVGITYFHYRETIFFTVASLVLTCLISYFAEPLDLKRILLLLIYFIEVIIVYVICIYDFFAPDDYPAFCKIFKSATHGQVKLLWGNKSCGIYMLSQVTSLGLLAVPGIRVILNGFNRILKKPPKKLFNYIAFIIIMVPITCGLFFLLDYYLKIL